MTGADDAIFIWSAESERFEAVTALPFVNEAEVQRLLEQEPGLLAGYQMNRGDPRRFLLVRREAAVPDHDGGRWSLDHLFVDQDAVPTLVEVKRADNDQIRRKVVGQLLDYAANGSRYWDDDLLRRLFEETHPGDQAQAVLIEVFGDSIDPDQFWRQAERNLRGGRLRLVFVADEIPVELRSIIEFLNERMETVEVLGVEIQRYGTTGERECVVPRVIGTTAVANRVKGIEPSLEDQFEAAEEVTRDVRARLDKLCLDDLRLTATPARKSMQYQNAGASLVRIYPNDGCIDLNLEFLHKREETEKAAHLSQRVQGCGGSNGKKYPTMKCAEVLANWIEVEQLIQTLVRLHRNGG